MELKNKLRTEAARLGFTLFGVTTASPPQSMPVYLRWLDAGYHGEMAYLAADRAVQRRADPLTILPEAKSIISLGFPYSRPDESLPPPGDGIYGRVSAYAWGRDYHDLIPPRLEQLSAFLQRETGTAAVSRGYTDTGPILERDFASRAGLGWIGKNSCLINPKAGSYFFLAELLTSFELEPDEPFRADHCGSCRRCIEACPTGCILPDRTIDARRCISYLTIENKGSIAAELRPSLDDWVFGCDICQQVCPWNIRFAEAAGDAEFLPQTQIARPNLIADLSLSPQGFNRRFIKSPIPRAKRRGYLRNAAIALGNSGSTEAVPALIDSLQTEPEPLIRAHVAWALGRINTRAAKAALVKAQSTENHPEVIEEIKAALDSTVS